MRSRRPRRCWRGGRRRRCRGGRWRQRPTRLGDARPPSASAPPICHARWEGCDLHACVRIAAGRRDRLERVCRYALRPPLAGERLHLTGTGDVALQLRRPWADGTTHLVFVPVALLALPGRPGAPPAGQSRALPRRACSPRRVAGCGRAAALASGRRIGGDRHKATGGPRLALGRPDAARVCDRRAGVPGLRWAPPPRGRADASAATARKMRRDPTRATRSENSLAVGPTSASSKPALSSSSRTSRRVRC